MTETLIPSLRVIRRTLECEIAYTRVAHGRARAHLPAIPSASPFATWRAARWR